MVAPGLAQDSLYTVEIFFDSQIAEWVAYVAELLYSGYPLRA